MKFAMTAPVAFFKGIASTHFVKYSVAVMIQIYPLEVGLVRLDRAPKYGMAKGCAYLAKREWVGEEDCREFDKRGIVVRKKQRLSSWLANNSQC